MKKIISVIIISTLLLGAVVVEQIFVQNTLNNLIEKIETLNAQIENSQNIDGDDFVFAISEMDKFWTEKERILCLSINHNDLNKVGEQIKRVQVYLEQNIKEECLVELNALLFYAESYKHVMEITPQNFF